MRIRLFFLIVLLLEIYGSLTWNRPLVWMTKPLLMPLLMYLAWNEGIRSRILYVALFFSFLGDVFLMVPGWFIPGLVAFLLAHLSYIVLFKGEARFSLLPLLLFGLASGAFLVYLYPSLPSEMRIPVVMYCLAITTMGIIAASRNTTSRRSYILVVVGAALFIISDALIAFDRFHTPVPNDALYVMTTYGAAQYLILQGWIYSLSSPHRRPL